MKNIKVYPFQDLGYSNYGWLESRHHFSFGNYHNINRDHFGALQVINDDHIAINNGFPLHFHKDMEIITYVRQGTITHNDNIGNKGYISAGNIQVMSAGKGIYHSEYNLGNEETLLYQIWISPNKLGVTPRWDSKEFPKSLVSNELQLLVSGREEDKGKGGLYIHQDGAIYGGVLTAGTVINKLVKYQAYILVSKGTVLINDVLLNEGDGAEITTAKSLTIKAMTIAELLVIDVL